MPNCLIRVGLAAALSLCSVSAMSETLPVVRFIATGGTIAMKVDPETKGVKPAVTGDELLQAAPEAGRHARVEVENFSNIPSAHIDPAAWARLTKTVEGSLAREDVAGVVIAHGTDTLEETAFWLDLTVRSDKPVVLIGAQRNGSAPDFDGPRNLVNAVRIATAAGARGKGVMIAMNNQINAARFVTKTHTANVETFKSGDYGFLGEVWDDRVAFSRAPERRRTIALRDGAPPRVEIIPTFAGADGALLRYAVDQGAAGIVIQALGMGNVNPPMFEAIEYALSKNVPVVIATRVHNGRTRPLYGFRGGGKTLAEAGAVMAGDLTPQKARILLILAMQDGVAARDDLQAAFDR